MHTAALPDATDIARLLALGDDALATLPGAVQWRGDGGLPWPVYPPALDAFFTAASEPAWSAPDYVPARCAEALADPSRVGGADLAELRRLLTFMVRGERFCDGHWGAMLSSGKLARWLDRLAQLA